MPGVHDSGGPSRCLIIQRIMQGSKAEHERPNSSVNEQLTQSNHPTFPPTQFYRRYLAWIMRNYGARIDENQADHMVAKRMVKLGYDAQAIKQAIREASPNLANRHGDTVEEYLTTTVRKVMSSNNK